MLSLLAEPEVKSEGTGWVLLLWVCRPFDDDYSFRDFFAGITPALQRTASVTFDLPSEEPGEDFVDGSLYWGSREYSLYYERSLGYVQFTTPDEDQARDLLTGLRDAITWAEA